MRTKQQRLDSLILLKSELLEMCDNDPCYMQKQMLSNLGDCIEDLKKEIKND